MSKTVVAKNRIDGVPGFGSIESGTVFKCPDDQYDVLKNADAIDDYAQPEVAVAQPADEQPAGEAPAPSSKGKAKKGDDGL